MPTLVPFTLISSTNPAVVVNPANNANGIAEWRSSASDSQSYKCTASVRSTNNNTRKYTFKITIPKVATSVVGGVEIPTSAWKAIVNVDVTIPVFATTADASLVSEAINNAFKAVNPFATAINTNSGFY